jgi:glutamyl-tRNA reductase
MEALAVEPLISSLRQRAEAIRQQELARTLPYLSNLDDVTLNHIHHLSRSLVNKLLHEPTTRLRQRAGAAQTDEYTAVVRDLFNLGKGEG